jgi:hypothetical protein
MKIDDLSFKAELQSLRSLYGIDPRERIDDYIVRNAAAGQSYVVFNAARDAFLRAIEISDKATNERAIFFLKFGAARRLEMIFFAYRSVIFTVPPTRKNPLKAAETQRLTQDHNGRY